MGGLGTAPMQQHLRSILVYFNTHVMGQPEFYLSSAQDKLQKGGVITDEKTKEVIEKFLAALAVFVEA